MTPALFLRDTINKNGETFRTPSGSLKALNIQTILRTFEAALESVTPGQIVVDASGGRFAVVGATTLFHTFLRVELMPILEDCN